MKRTVIFALAAAAAIGAAGSAQAAISYSTAGSTYEENFDGLPHRTNPLSANLDNVIRFNNAALISNGTNPPFTGGWKDDADFDGTNLGIKGWHLWHGPSLPNGGANGHAQVRYGNGAGTSGAFYVFTSGIVTNLTTGETNGDITEKALGILSTAGINGTNVGRVYIGMQLINDTGRTLDSFTITYDGEQYREAANAAADGFDLQWSLAADASNWQSSDAGQGFYSGVSGVDYGGFGGSFRSPINTGTAAALDGNVAANRIADITHTVTGIEWEPGAELWIRWRDEFVGDSVAIDNVRFTATAIPEPATLVLAGAGLAAVGLMRRKR